LRKKQLPLVESLLIWFDTIAHHSDIANADWKRDWREKPQLSAPPKLLLADCRSPVADVVLST
jgi:hypothetical protein